MSGDLVYALLGCSLPVLLRPTDSSAFQVVSPYFVHAIMDGQAVLGPLPSPWSAAFTYLRQQKWSSATTTELSDRDPRLPALPLEWEQVTVDIPASVSLEWRNRVFRNHTTGGLLRSDPYLVPGNLEKTCEELGTFPVEIGLCEASDMDPWMCFYGHAPGIRSCHLRQVGQ